MTKKSDAPAIRFKGFSDAWEQRKLGDIASDIVAGGDIDKDLILAEGQYPVIANALTGDGIVGYYDKEYRVNAPAVTVTGRGDVGHAKTRLVNFTPVVRLLSVKSEHDVFFLENAINTLKIVIESTGVPQLTVPQLAKYEVAFPRQLDEEKHIGAFFKQLDHLITLHQRKFEKLTNVKKSMLEKMFPQNGSSYPEIRFKGFTDPWEQRKLGDAFERVVRKNTNNESRLPLTISAQDGLVDQITYFNNRVASRDVSNYYLVYNGEFAYNKSTSDGYPFGAVKRLDWYEKGVLSTLYIVFALKHPEKDDSDFMTVFYDTDRWHRGVAERAAEGARNHGLLNISADDFFDIDTTMPEDKVEQEKIGRLLKKLDTLITLHQRKYERLVNIKKSMLDKMFPQNGASVPEIRFKGFTDPWEQRKVGTLIEDYTEKTVTQNQYPVLTSSQQQGIVLQEDYFADRQVTTDNNVGYYVLPKGYFTYRSRSDTDVFVFNRNNIVDKGIISYYYPVFAPKSCDSNFLLRRLNHGIKKQLSMAAEGTGQKVLAHAKFKNMVVDVPSQSEQEKIGTILEELDTLITLHQREHIKPILEVKRVKRNE